MADAERWGGARIINASGTVTRLGGALMSAKVIEAWCQAAQYSVALDQLQAAASRQIAARCGVEAGLVVGGAAAGLMLGTAAILTGWDRARMEALPDATGFPHEVLVARSQRNGYDHAVRLAGARLIDVGMDERVSGAGVRPIEAWEYQAAIGPQTAGILFTLTRENERLLPSVVKLAHDNKLPVLVDAAAQLPPEDNLRAIAATDADLFVFSGGKALGGPQATGILAGRRALVGSAFVQMMDSDERPELWDPPAEFIDRACLPGLPRQGIGRVAKVAKEEIVALLTALDAFTAESVAARRATQLAWLEQLRLQLLPQVAEAKIVGNAKPRLLVRPAATSPSLSDIHRRLRQGTPAVYLGTADWDAGYLSIHPDCLRVEDLPVLAARLTESLA